MRTRFAPSPTGYLHLGHVYSALQCQALGGEMLLRFEDIDFTRVREEYYEAIVEDLAWMGITFAHEPWRQLDRMHLYEQALERLKELGVVYPCFCTRKELMHHNLSAPHDDQVVLYNGHCKGMSETERMNKIADGVPYSWRLDSEKAQSLAGALTFTDERRGEIVVEAGVLGDVILARKDIKTSYHIAVVVDDAAQGITDVVRGADLFDSTHVHRLLQALLELPTPHYHHHDLICDEQGKRLAKRHHSLAVRTLREQGLSAAEVRARI